jgi:hypothetical protein
MFHRTTASLATTALLTLAATATTPSAAHAQLQQNGSPIAYGNNTFGLAFFPGTNSQVSASAVGNTLSSTFTGDMSAAIIGSFNPGTYSGGTNQGAIVPFSVTVLPVLIGHTSLNANFKIVASGGDGLAGGNDPVMTVTLRTRIYQVQNNTYQPTTDPFIPTSEIIQTYIQNGNGLQIINSNSGPINTNYILTPGNYYMSQEITIAASYTSTGVPELTRGMTMEFGGTLTHGTYSGITYTLDWQTVPTPGAAAALGLGGLMTFRRRRN